MQAGFLYLRGIIFIHYHEHVFTDHFIADNARLAEKCVWIHSVGPVRQPLMASHASRLFFGWPCSSTENEKMGILVW